MDNICIKISLLTVIGATGHNQVMNDTKSTQNIKRDDAQDRLFFNFEKKLALSGKKGMNTILKKLNFLCLKFDPYQAQEQSQEITNILEEFELTAYLENPFIYTNIVLQMIDKTQSHIKERLH